MVARLQRPPTERSSYTRKLLLLYWGAYALFQIYLSCNLWIDYNDAFGFLHNARRLTNLPIGYVPIRAPLVAILHAPLQKILDWCVAGDSARMLFPHLFQGILSASLLFFFYCCLRRHFSYGWAQAGTILLSLNRLTLHYFPFIMSDIPATLCLVLFFYFWRGPAFRAGTLPILASLTGGLLARWNMLILLPLLLLLRAGRWWGGVRRERDDVIRLGLLLGASAILFLWVSTTVYWSVSPLGWFAALKFFMGVLVSQFQYQQTAEPTSEYIGSLFASCGEVAPVLFILGAIATWRKRIDLPIFHAAFFLLFFLAMSTLVGHKESRYLFPILPSFYFVALYGMNLADIWMRERTKPLLRIIAIAATTISVIRPASREIIQWADPIYKNPILLDTVDLARRHSGAQTAYFWSGDSYSVVPANPHFTFGDEYYYLYHVPSVSSFAYLIGVLPAPMGLKRPQTGDIAIEVPRRPFLRDQPLPIHENQIRVLRYERGAWNVLAAIPAARPEPRNFYNLFEISKDSERELKRGLWRALFRRPEHP